MEVFFQLSRKQKYSKEFRIKIVKQYLEGQFTANQLVDKYKIARASVYNWVNIYNIHGPDIFNKKIKNSCYTIEFKIEVIRYALSHSVYMSCVKYNMSCSVVSNWLKMYNQLEEIKDYNMYPQGEIYNMKSKPTTYGDKLEIVKYCVKHNFNYTLTAAQYEQPYSQVYNWTRKYKKLGEDGLKDKRGMNKPEADLTELEKYQHDVKRLRHQHEMDQMEILLLKKVKELGEKAARKKRH